MSNAKLLWVDDEVDLLKGHMMYLREKAGEAMSNGVDMIVLKEQAYDTVFLDEQMPGMDGLTTLEIQQIRPNMPVSWSPSRRRAHHGICFGAEISDHHIKVKPTQILLALKRSSKISASSRRKSILITSKIFATLPCSFEDNDYQD